MFAINKLRLHRFRKVEIPRARVLFEKFGFRAPATPQGVDVDASADDVRNVIPSNIMASKISALALAEQTAKKRQEFENRPSQTEPLHFRDLEKL